MASTGRILAATTAVGVWRDMLNSQLTIATVWCGLNTFVLGVFLVVAFVERHVQQHGGADVQALDAKSLALGEILAAPEPRTTPQTLVLAQVQADAEASPALRAAP